MISTADRVVIRTARPEDLHAILALQKRSFRTEAERYGRFDIPPLRETIAMMRDDYRRFRYLKALAEDGTIIGSVKARLVDGATCYIGRLMTAPEHRGRGIGRSLMLAAEEVFPEAARYALIAGHLSEDNIRLYRRLGYEEYGREPMGDSGIYLVFMEKLTVPDPPPRPVLEH